MTPVPHDGKLSGCEVLLVDDEQTIVLALRDSLKDAGATVVTASSGDQALNVLAAKHYDVVISDVRMPGLSGMDLLRKLKQAAEYTEVILMTAYANIEHAVAAMKIGAYDYVTKPFPNEKMVRVVENAWTTARLRTEVRDLRCGRAYDADLGFLVGKSDAWVKVLDRVRMVAPTDSTVLVIGASGTGKELVARALHVTSNRRDGPFIKVHCASLPPTLMEAELFGHTKGAFTGAGQEMKGRFELANRGTLLLDEVDEIPLEVQVKLLRVIQERVVERVGSGQSIPIDVRLVASSKGSLEALVAAGKFRQDLMYRLTVVQLPLPSLAERKDDVPLLIDHFLSKVGEQSGRHCPGFARPALDLLLAYDYPGNVRELEHIVESACALSDGKTAIGPELLPDGVRERGKSREIFKVGFAARPLSDVVEDFERSYLSHALREFKGSRQDLARVLGISRKSLWEKLKRHKLAGSESEEP
ncbi:MAG: sigma-54-dependent Fis family transcriptional regulator [Deltaproteobacteria bacterium]|nr:sigma-54-dependent Fis family transcriptional regulator [Deltaproteobacteria bacterium]